MTFQIKEMENAFERFEDICAFLKSKTPSKLTIFPRNLSTLAFLRQNELIEKGIPNLLDATLAATFYSDRCIELFINHLRRHNLYFSNVFRWMSKQSSTTTVFEMEISFATAFRDLVDAFQINRVDKVSNLDMYRMKLVHLDIVENYNTAENVREIYNGKYPKCYYYEFEWFATFIILCSVWLVETFRNNKWTFSSLSTGDLILPLCVLEPLYIYGTQTTQSMIRQLMKKPVGKLNKLILSTTAIDPTLLAIKTFDLIRGTSFYSSLIETHGFLPAQETRSFKSGSKRNFNIHQMTEKMALLIQSNISAAQLITTMNTMTEKLFREDSYIQKTSDDASLLQFFTTVIASYISTEKISKDGMTVLSKLGTKLTSTQLTFCGRKPAFSGSNIEYIQSLIRDTCIPKRKMWSSSSVDLIWTIPSAPSPQTRIVVALPNASMLDAERYVQHFNWFMERFVGRNSNTHKHFHKVNVTVNSIHNNIGENNIMRFEIIHASLLTMHLIHIIASRRVKTSRQQQNTDLLILPRAPLLYKILSRTKRSKRLSKGDSVTFLHYYIALRITQMQLYEESNPTTMLPLTHPNVKSHYLSFSTFISSLCENKKSKLVKELRCLFGAVFDYQFSHNRAANSKESNKLIDLSENRSVLLRAVRCFLNANEDHFLDYNVGQNLYGLLHSTPKTELSESACRLYSYLRPTPENQSEVWLPNRRFVRLDSQSTIDFYQVILKEQIADNDNSVSGERMRQKGTKRNLVDTKVKHVYLENIYLQRCLRPSHALLKATTWEDFVLPNEKTTPDWLKSYQKCFRCDNHENWTNRQPLLALFLQGIEQIYANNSRDWRKKQQLFQSKQSSLVFLDDHPNAWSPWFYPDYRYIGSSDVSISTLLEWHSNSGWRVLFCGNAMQKLSQHLSCPELVDSMYFMKQSLIKMNT